MRRHLRILTIIVLLLTLVVAIPAGFYAQDDPAVSVTPDSGEIGSAILDVEVSGLSAGDTYTIEFVFDGVVVFATEQTADDDGNIVFQAASSDDDEPGTYTIQIVSNDSIIADTEFELSMGTDEGATPDESDEIERMGDISITPASGPINTLHTITISELEPTTNYTLEVLAVATDEVVYRRIWSSDDEGVITVEIFANEGDTSGQQVVTVYDDDGEVVAQDQFTIEAPLERNPVVEVTPQVAEAGREFTIRIEGLAQFDSVTAQITSGNNTLIETLRARASNEGVAILSFLSGDELAEGEYSIAIFVDDERMATETLTIGDSAVADNNNDSPQTSEIALMVEPEAAPVGSTHVMSITGLEADQAFTLTISNHEGEIEYTTTRTADANGEFSIHISSAEGDEAGLYPVEITDATSGLVLASAQMQILNGDVPQSSGSDVTAQTGTPSIRVDPEAGEIGTTHTISLSGMPAGERVGVVIRAQSDETLALSSVVMTDDNGNGTVEFTSREINTAGTYVIAAVQPAGELATTTLTIEGALVTIEPQSGVIGSTHAVNITGLEPNEIVTIDVLFDGEAVFSTERTADSNGAATLNLTTEEGDAVGDYTVSVNRESGDMLTATLTALDTESADSTTSDTSAETTVDSGIQVIEGSLENGIAEIEFSGEANQYFIITVESDDFDTVAAIYDSESFEIAYNDDSRGHTNSRIGPLLLPYTGDYTLQVSQSIYIEQDTPTGDFTATIEPVTVESLTFDEPIAFSLSPDTPARYYELQVEAGDSYDIFTNSTGTLDITLQVLYSDGYEYAFDDDSGAGFDAEFNNLIFDFADTYILVVSGFVESASGEGTLTVSRNPVKSLDEGAVTITLNDKLYQDIVTFSAEEGEVVTLNLERLSGMVEDLYITATVDGVQVMSYSTMGVPDKLPLTFVMPMSGEVIVTLEEYGFGVGITFDLAIEKR